MSNRILNCTTCNDNSPITFVADDSLIPLYEGIPASIIIGLNSVGSIDESFIYGNGFNGSVFTIVHQSDGEILVGGDFSSYDGTPSNYIIRLNSDGSIDNTFVIGDGFNNTVRTIAIQSDGKILVGGNFIQYDGTPSNHIIRLNSDGSIDNTFVIGDGFNDTVITIAIQSDGKILVGGGFSEYDGTNAKNIIRLNTDGSIDNTFVIGGGFNAGVNTMLIKDNGPLLIGGDFTTYKPTYISKIIRLNTSGLYDGSLFYKIGFDSEVNTIALQSDGKILVGGNFGTYDGTPSNYIIRLNSDGSIDNTFVIGDGFNDTVITIAIQSDGKILVGGNFTDYDSIPANYIIRLNSDGSIDNTFVVGDGFNGNVLTIEIQSDGKILAGGGFTSYSGTVSNYIIRLNSDGSIDNTFVVGNGFNDTVITIAIQSDGKILVGGNFIQYDGTPSNHIIRLNPDGSIDDTFVVGNGFSGRVYTIQIQSDGKILVGGNFTDYDSIPANYIIRLNSDGSIDNTFVNGTGFSNKVRTIEIQSDGKILVGGDFSSYDGTPSNYIIRLNPDGSIDDTFVVGNGFNGDVYTIQIQSDGKILVGGDFSTYPLNSGVFQLQEGNCVSLDSYGVVSRNQPERLITFGPFISCIECSTPDDSAGVESIICISCDDVYSVTATTVPHAIYLNNQGRAISQINTVAIGGFNGLNN